MLRIFFDANVIIAGSMSRRGASRALLILAEAGMFKMVVSKLVLDEVERNLRLKLPQALPIMADLLDQIHPEVIADPQPDEFAHWLPLIEHKDAPILQAALNAGVNYLITLNTRDFTSEVAEASGLTIMEPRQFVERLREVISGGLG